jgi:lysophospholipase L1-like esterase
VPASASSRPPSGSDQAFHSRGIRLPSAGVSLAYDFKGLDKGTSIMLDVRPTSLRWLDSFDGQTPYRRDDRWIALSMNTQPLVACLGSSRVHGTGQSCDWVPELQSRSLPFAFKNFGAGGDLSCHVLKRLPRVIACQPNQVLIWVGTNDVLAIVSRKFRRLLSLMKGLSPAPSAARFQQNLETIVTRLKTETRARIGLCSLAPVGENLQSCDAFQAELNGRVSEFSKIVAQVARRQGCRYIAVHEVLTEAMGGTSGQSYRQFQLLPICRDAFRTLVLREDLNLVAAQNGWRWHTDGIHLNRNAGILVADRIQEFLLSG